MRKLAEASIWICPDGLFNNKKEVRAELISVRFRPNYILFYKIAADFKSEDMIQTLNLQLRLQ